MSAIPSNSAPPANQSIGRVSALRRYPVKSMAGEPLEEALLTRGGIAKDRCYAFHSSRARPEFPYFTAREHPPLLQYRPEWRENSLVIRTPDEAEYDIEDQRLCTLLMEQAPGHVLSVLHSQQAMTDSFPASFLSLQTVQQLAEEMKQHIDPWRFRPNILADLSSKSGFVEDQYVGKTLRIGDTALLEIVERDQRCKIITLDPATSQADPAIVRHVSREHGNCVGVYARVLREGLIRSGDPILLSD